MQQLDLVHSSNSRQIATPSMSEGSSKVDLVSFVVKDIAGNTGTGATELLASAGLNYGEGK